MPVHIHVVSDPGRLMGNLRSKGAAIRTEIAHLITRYGPWGGVVATFSGDVIHARQYLLAAKLTRTPLVVFAVPDDEAPVFRRYLDRTYGVFSYDHIERETYVQSLAQMMRLRQGPSGKSNRSTLYENHVLPWLRSNRGADLLDFGSGQGDYYRRIVREGYSAWEIELFRRIGGNKEINLLAVNRMIDRTVARLEVRRFDAVVCDSVLNSVDSQTAEDAVMATVNAFTVPGGRAFLSGRPLEKAQAVLRRTRQDHRKTVHKRELYFEDGDGLSALFRDGRWFFQKFHTREAARSLVERFGFEVVAHVHGENSWQIEARKVSELPWRVVSEALDFEFDLPVGHNRRLGRSVDVKKIMRQYYAEG